MESDLSPFRGPVDDRHDVANVGGFEGDAGDAGFIDQGGGIQKSREFKAAADAEKFTNFRGEQVLSLKPGGIGGGGQFGDARLPQRRGGVGAQEVAERIEFQDASAGVSQGLGNHRDNGTSSSMINTETGKGLPNS